MKTPAAQTSARASQGSELRVRRATSADLDAVVRLRLALLREYPQHAIYGRLRADAEVRARDLYAAQLRAANEVIFLADFGAESVGILRCVDTQASPLFEPARYGYVSSVFVRRDVRQRGVLRALLSAAEQWCAARGLTELRLHNVPGGVAETAWQALGFGVVEQVRLKQLSGR